MLQKAWLFSMNPKTAARLRDALLDRGISLEMRNRPEGSGLEACHGQVLAFFDETVEPQDIVGWNSRTSFVDRKCSWVWVAPNKMAPPTGPMELLGRVSMESLAEDVTTCVDHFEALQKDTLAPITSSASMQRVMRLVETVADADVPVLLLGESGTGKEVVARQIHQQSHRSAQPFIKVNCAALPSELLESELFGHDKGSFTGATSDKPGKFELAHKGTIFLDEIGEMDVRLQAKLLQVLQDEEYFRVGGKKYVQVDARVVVATNRNLDEEIEKGNFREDLFYRLNVVAIRLLPLRERKEDIRPLVRHFVKKYGVHSETENSALWNEMLNAFESYRWPGNVRQLENFVRRWSVLRDAQTVLDEINVLLNKPSSGNGEGKVVEKQSELGQGSSLETVSLKEIGKKAAMLAEREAIVATLRRTGWNKRRAAARLQISYKALLYKIKEGGIVDPRDECREEDVLRLPHDLSSLPAQ